METVFLVLAVLAGGAACAGWRWYSYPGGRACAFGQEYAAERKDLATARRGVRILEQQARRELSEAKGQVRSEEARYRERVREAEQRLEEARSKPGRGEHQYTLGELALYDHTLQLRGRGLPLAGLEVRLERTPAKCCIHLTSANGDKAFARYPGGEFEEDRVRLFHVAVQNAAVNATSSEKLRIGRIAEAEAELAQARANTAPQESARQRLDQVAERQRQDKRLETAQAELEAARGRWQAATGHWPR